MTIKTVYEIPRDLKFCNDSQDVDAIKDHIGSAADEFDAFFVRAEDGEYTEVWGIVGIVPSLWKIAHPLISQAAATE